MLFSTHAKLAKKVALSLGRRGYSADAALFKECALFCESLDQMKANVGSPCWTDYQKILRKLIKNTNDACMRHKDIPICVDYIAKNKEFKGGCFHDLSNVESQIYEECMNDDRVTNKEICCNSIKGVRNTSGYNTAQDVFADRVSGGRKQKKTKGKKH